MPVSFSAEYMVASDPLARKRQGLHRRACSFISASVDRIVIHSIFDMSKQLKFAGSTIHMSLLVVP